MTISSTTRKAGPFTGNGSATAFPFTFKVFEPSDVQVLLIDLSGGQSTLTLDSDYSVALNADQNNTPGGVITYPKSGTPMSTGYKLVVIGALPYDQQSDITNAGGFYPEDVEDMSDRSTIQIQQLAEIVSRAIVVTAAESTSPALPAGAVRANMMLGFDVTGNLTLLPIPASIGAGDMRVDTFTDGVDYTSGSSTQLILSRPPGTLSNCLIFFAASFQGPDQVASLAGTLLTFTAPIPAGVDKVYVISGTSVSIFKPAIGSVIDAAIDPTSELYNRINDELSVTDFGADNSGLNDSLAAFNAAAAKSALQSRTVFVPAGTYKLSATPTIGTSSWRVSPGAVFTSGSTIPSWQRGFWTNISGVPPFGSGANIHRLNDRVMIGTSTNYDGSNNPVYPKGIDWIADAYKLPSGAGAYEYLLTNATLAVGAPYAQCGISAYARTSDRPAGGGGTIGVASALVNDNGISNGYNTWTFYGTSVRAASATGTNTTGIEIDVANLGTVVPIFPNQMFNTGQTVGIGVCAGGEIQDHATINIGVSSAAYTIAMNDVKGNAKWEKGIVFHSQGLLMDSGNIGTAIAFGVGHALRWFDNGNFLTNSIVSTTTTGATGNGQSIFFSDNGFFIADSGGNAQFRVLNGIANSANYVEVQAAPLGGIPQIRTQGGDANVDLQLTPAGSGLVRFGAYNAAAVTQTGYITIKDAAGNTRRLLVG